MLSLVVFNAQAICHPVLVQLRGSLLSDREALCRWRRFLFRRHAIPLQSKSAGGNTTQYSNVTMFPRCRALATARTGDRAQSHTPPERATPVPIVRGKYQRSWPRNKTQVSYPNFPSFVILLLCASYTQSQHHSLSIALEACTSPSYKNAKSHNSNSELLAFGSPHML